MLEKKKKILEVILNYENPDGMAKVLFLLITDCLMNYLVSLGSQ